MWPSATGRIGLLLAILFVVFAILYLRHVSAQQREAFVISNDGLIELGQKGTKCPKGSFCPPLSGKAFLCPGGTYGDKEGLITAACSGLCDPGYVCDPGSVSKTAKQCPAGFYCIAGTASIGPITPTICPEGYFCPAGSAVPQKCGEMETCPEGTGACPPGSTSCEAPTEPAPGGETVAVTPANTITRPGCGTLPKILATSNRAFYNESINKLERSLKWPNKEGVCQALRYEGLTIDALGPALDISNGSADFDLFLLKLGTDYTRARKTYDSSRNYFVEIAGNDTWNSVIVYLLNQKQKISDVEINQALIDSISTTKNFNTLLNTKGVDVNYRGGRDSAPPIWYAVKNNFPEKLKPLIEKGANVNVKARNSDARNYESTLLILAISKCKECVKILLEAGADPNEKILISGNQYEGALWHSPADLKDLLVSYGAK
jgi:hypothetical protein